MRRSRTFEGYDYLGCHTDDVTIVSHDTDAVLEQLMSQYEITKPGEPLYHLGCDYHKITVDGVELWHISSDTHVREGIKKIEERIGGYAGLDEGNIYFLSIARRTLRCL